MSDFASPSSAIILSTSSLEVGTLDGDQETRQVDGQRDGNVGVTAPLGTQGMQGKLDAAITTKLSTETTNGKVTRTTTGSLKKLDGGLTQIPVGKSTHDVGFSVADDVSATEMGASSWATREKTLGGTLASTVPVGDENRLTGGVRANNVTTLSDTDGKASRAVMVILIYRAPQ